LIAFYIDSQDNFCVVGRYFKIFGGTSLEYVDSLIVKMLGIY